MNHSSNLKTLSFFIWLYWCSILTSIGDTSVAMSHLFSWNVDSPDINTYSCYLILVWFRDQKPSNPLSRFALIRVMMSAEAWPTNLWWNFSSIMVTFCSVVSCFWNINMSWTYFIVCNFLELTKATNTALYFVNGGILH